MSYPPLDDLPPVVTLPVGGSAGDPYRTASWLPANPLGNPAVGVLEVRQGTHPTKLKPAGRYAVVELAFTDGHRFKLTKPGARGEAPEEPYWVMIDPTGVEGDLCTCIGFEATGGCKHVLSLRALIWAKVIVGLGPPEKRAVKIRGVI